MIRCIILSCILVLFNSLGTYASQQDTLLNRLNGIKSPEKQVVALNRASEVCWQTGHYKAGITYSNKGLEIARFSASQATSSGQRNKFRKLEANLLNNLGIIYDYQGDYSQSLKCYFTALRIQEKIKDEAGQAYSMSNIGLIYTNQNNNDEALYYHTKSLKLRKKIKFTSGIAASYNNIGICYLNKKDFTKALEYFTESKKIDVQMKDSIGLMDDLNNIGLCLMEQKKYNEAIRNFKECLSLRLHFKDQYGASKAINNIATCYMKQKKFAQAEIEFKKGLEIGKKIGGNESIWYSYENLSEIAEMKGNYKDAFDYLTKALEIKSEWNSASSIRDEAETELSYQFEKKSELEKMRQLKKDLKKEMNDKARATQNKVIFWSLGIIVAIVAIFAIILFSRWKIATRQKRIIDEQRAVVEEKNEEIMDSINYAQRIQSAILPSFESIRTVFPNFGIIFQPKDVVAGDFYWMHQTGNTVFIAVADCTGHGVPGAFMSLLCNNALNRAILEAGATTPGEILTKARTILLAEFAKSQMNLNDGMDVSICAWNMDSKQLSWAGANNPLWILKQGSNEIIELKGDKQPVGNHHDYKDFTTHQVEIVNGDKIFLFSDGMPDQFGGPNGKKFKTKQLKEVILRSSREDIGQQVKTIGQSINNWKGELSQVDDICFLGIRI